MTTSEPPPAESTNTRTLKIAGLVALGCVALCGLAGTCLFVALLILTPQLGQ